MPGKHPAHFWELGLNPAWRPGTEPSHRCCLDGWCGLNLTLRITSCHLFNLPVLERPGLFARAQANHCQRDGFSQVATLCLGNTPSFHVGVSCPRRALCSRGALLVSPQRLLLLARLSALPAGVPPRSVLWTQRNPGPQGFHLRNFDRQ